MWVTKLLISAVKIRIFCPKKSKFGPKMAFLFILGQTLPAHLVGGCGAQAVSRKTPIYFILITVCEVEYKDMGLGGNSKLIYNVWHCLSPLHL